MALCIPISKYRQVKKLRDDALGKVEDVTKEFDELKETTEEYKTKYEDLQKQMDNAKSMSPGGLSGGMGGDELDGTMLLGEESYKSEAIKSDSWPAEMKVKDVAKMSMEYLHQGHITKDLKGSRASLKGTLSVKPLQVTIVNLSKTTTLQIASSYFKSGRFAAQPEGVIEAGESHTYGISSKDGRAKTSVKGGMSFTVCDVPEPLANGDAGMDEDLEEEGADGENTKKTKEEKKKERQEKKELKRQERKSKKEAKKKRKESSKAPENSEPKENGEEGEEEEKPEETQENGEATAENDDVIVEENEDGSEPTESVKEEEPQSPTSTKEPSIHEDHDDEEDEMPEGNGDFFVVAFENPLAGVAKAKSNKTSSKDVKPLVKQLKNDKPVEQALSGHWRDGKRHFVFIWKDEELQW